MQFLIATTFVVISLVGVVSQCPHGCSCNHFAYITVNCRYRGLSSIPKDIPHATADLDLSFNEISVIEMGPFSNLSELGDLDLSYNTISEIERGAFNNLLALDKLDLSYNAISEIERGTFNLSTLSTIDLSYSAISKIERGAFETRYVITLDLSYNAISKIERGAFDTPILEELNLNGNKITRVEAWFLDGMLQIRQLLMESNNISFISEKAFQNQAHLHIKLKMICGCIDNYPFWKWLRESHKLKQSIGCYDHIGSYLEDLSPKNFHNCSVTTSRTTASPPNRTTATPSNRTTSTPAYRRTATPSSRTTSTQTSRKTMTTTSASRIIIKKLEATTFAPRAVIGIVLGAGSLAACLLLFGVIWRLWRQSKEKRDKIRCYTSNTTE